MYELHVRFAAVQGPKVWGAHRASPVPHFPFVQVQKSLDDPATRACKWLRPRLLVRAGRPFHHRPLVRSLKLQRTSIAGRTLLEARMSCTNQ
jgi:hypothetical protein